MSNQNSTIKYSAIASAVALACAASISQAGAIQSGAAGGIQFRTYSLQGHETAPATTGTGDNTFATAAGNFTVVLGTAYAVNDTLTLGISGAQFRTAASLPGQIVCGKNGSASTIVLSFLSKSATTATVRVTEGTGLDGMAGASCLFPTASFSFTQRSAVTLGASSISLQLTSYVGGNTSQPFDTTALVDVGGVANQFSAGAKTSTADTFSGTVDVNVDRRSWTEGLTRTLILSYSSTSDTNAVAGSAVSAVTSIYGAAGTQMFSFLDDDGNGCTAADLAAGPGSATVSGGTLGISADCATLTITETGLVGTASATAERTITLATRTASTGLQIADGSFTAAVAYTVSVSTTATQSVSGFAAGSFGLNGTVITVPYMPYGLSGSQEISQVYSVANTGSTTGTVTAIARNQAGVLCSLGSVGVATARSVVNLSEAINQGIAACYAGSSTAAASAFPARTRVFVTLTSNTAAANTVVTSTYNVGSNGRVNVINNSQRVNNQ